MKTITMQNLEAFEEVLKDQDVRIAIGRAIREHIENGELATKASNAIYDLRYQPLSTAIAHVLEDARKWDEDHNHAHHVVGTAQGVFWMYEEVQDK